MRSSQQRSYSQAHSTRTRLMPFWPCQPLPTGVHQRLHDQADEPAPRRRVQISARDRSWALIGALCPLSVMAC